MKAAKILSIFMTLAMLFCLVSCGNTVHPVDTPKETSAPTSEPATTAPEMSTPTIEPDVTEPPAQTKEEYYASYTASEDFGFAGSNVVMTTESEGSVLTITGGSDCVVWKMSQNDTNQEIGLYVKDGKVYVHLALINSESGELVDKWSSAVVPEGADPMGEYGRDNSQTFDAASIKSSRYLETVSVDGVQYDKVAFVFEKSEDTILDGSDEVPEDAIAVEYEALIREDTHRIVKLSCEDETNDENGETHKVTVIIDFLENTPEYDIPEDISEGEYDAVMLDFATGMFLLMFSQSGVVVQ